MLGVCGGSHYKDARFPIVKGSVFQVGVVRGQEGAKYINFSMKWELLEARRFKQSPLRKKDVCAGKVMYRERPEPV